MSKTAPTVGRSPFARWSVQEAEEEATMAPIRAEVQLHHTASKAPWRTGYGSPRMTARCGGTGAEAQQQHREAALLFVRQCLSWVQAAWRVDTVRARGLDGLVHPAGESHKRHCSRTRKPAFPYGAACA